MGRPNRDKDGPKAARGLTARRGLLAVAGLALSACGHKPVTTTLGSGSASVIASAAPSASASAAPKVVSTAVTGTPIATFVTADKAGCGAATADVAQYLQRGEISLAVREGEVATSYLIQLPGEAKIGFGAYDAMAKRAASDRGIGAAREHAPTLFGTPGGWIVTWFDHDGLAYARPKKDAEPHLAVDHLATVKDVPPEDLSLAANADGSLVVASPFGTSGDQLTLFKFGVGAKAPDAIGLTKHAQKPHRPVLAEDADGYALVWVEADGHLQSTRFDLAGKESGGSELLVGPGKHSDLTLVPTSTGFQLTWNDGDDVLTLGLGKDATADGPPRAVGKGHWPRTATAGDAVYVAFVGDTDGKPSQLLLTKVTGAEHTVSAAAVVVTDGAGPVKDPPSIGVVGGRVAVLWTEAMSATISTKRALLRTIDAACVK